VGKSSRLAVRAQWMRDCARRILGALNIHVECRGLPASRGVLAANHLGYIDIIVLGSINPTIFLSKSEVRQWPIFGPMAAWAGTLFIRRDKKSDVARFDQSFAQVIEEGVLLGIFPEGTSTDGHQVLPFHSSLSASATAAGWPVTPVWIGYKAKNGSVENDVCYWGDMTFFSHFRRLIALKEIRATVVFGDAIVREPNRKELARQLHRQVCEMAKRNRTMAMPAEDRSDLAATANGNLAKPLAG